MTEVITDPTPSILHGPSDKEKKYDRQLRLWAASGQQALEDAHILLVNSGSGTVGVETLKNLVLPGTPEASEMLLQLTKFQVLANLLSQMRTLSTKPTLGSISSWMKIP
jgi:molybdopterin/thiamine biosynthesis adenylyltransferase